MTQPTRLLVAGILAAVVCSGLWLVSGKAAQTDSAYRDWRVYGGSSDNLHYSALDQINRNTVRSLQVAWEYDAGDASPGSWMECTPIIIGNVLYATTPALRVIALDAETGKLLWSFDPTVGTARSRGVAAINRGLMYWASGQDQLIFVVARHSLWALEAKSGKPVDTFGESGSVDLRQG